MQKIKKKTSGWTIVPSNTQDQVKSTVATVGLTAEMLKSEELPIHRAPRRLPCPPLDLLGTSDGKFEISDVYNDHTMVATYV